MLSEKIALVYPRRNIKKVNIRTFKNMNIRRTFKNMKIIRTFNKHENKYI